jgi:UDP-N-acetylbacillosamine N-acetyltransferase
MEPTNTLAIYGQSGHGKVVADIALACGFSTILWIDDDPQKEQALSYDTFKKLYPNIPVALGIGDNFLRQKIFEKITYDNLSIPPLIHPSAIISKSATIDTGSVVMPLAIINADSHITKGVIINSGAIIEHDCHLGNFVHVSPGSALAGGVSVGALTHIGIGSSIIQNITIGSQSIIAAGSSVVSNVASNVMVAGAPAIHKKELHG